jgi:hypothetical protein
MRWGLAFAMAGLGLRPAFAALPWSAPFQAGERVSVEGLVVDRAGTPLAGLEVQLLRAAPGRMDLLHLRRLPPNQKVESSRTDAQGRFRLEWTWEEGFRRFELVVLLRDPGPQGPRYRELARQSIRDRLRWGSPIVLTLVVEQGDFVRKLQQFEASIESLDESRVFETWGRPDHIDQKLLPGGKEASWWYYEIGKVARFRNGELVETQDFPPISSSTKP